MHQKQKKIPTIAGLLILFIGLGGIIFFDSGNRSSFISAKPTISAEDTHITNITDNSFIVSWFTSQPIIGSVIVTEGLNSSIHIDDLDADNIPRPRTSHYITVSNLKEKTEYEVQIKLADNKCNTTSCPTFKQKTGKKLPTLNTSLPPISGQLETITSIAAQEAIIYASIGKAAPISGRVDKSGLYAIPLNNLRSADLLNRIDIADNDIVQIVAKISPLSYAEAVIDMKSIRLTGQLPLMQLGKSYNFIDLLSKKDIFASSNNSKILGTQIKQDGSLSTTNNNSSGKGQIDILFPKDKGDTTIDNQPRFRGIGIPGKQLLITVNSTPQTDRVTVNPDGIWTWRPPKSLAPGTHHINIQGVDTKGNIITVTKEFIVLKSGERVLGEATNSATLTPATGTPSPTPTLIVSITPTITLLPSITITSTASPTPTVLVVLSPSEPPRTGSIYSGFFLIGSGILLSVIGIKFLLLS